MLFNVVIARVTALRVINAFFSLTRESPDEDLIVAHFDEPKTKEEIQHYVQGEMYRRFPREESWTKHEMGALYYLGPLQPLSRSSPR